MPPKHKHTRDEIAAAAFQIIKEQGCSQLTARNLAAELQLSVGALFTQYRDMEEITLAARNLAVVEFRALYIKAGYEQTSTRTFDAIIEYGQYEPELFKLVFLFDWKRSKQKAEWDLSLQTIREETRQKMQERWNDAASEDAFDMLWHCAIGCGAALALGQASRRPEAMKNMLHTVIQDMK